MKLPTAGLHSVAVTRPELRECPGCGLFQMVPAMAPNLRCNCTRCGTPLRVTRHDPLNRHLALSFAALLLFAVVWLTMLMKVSTSGIVRETFLDSGPLELVARGLWPLAVAVAFTTAYAPLGKFLATFYVIIGLKLEHMPPNIRDVFLFSRRLNTWCMLEVLLLGVFVAYTKLGDLVTIELGPAVYALGVLTVVWLWAEVALDPHAVWDEIERRGQTHAPMPPPLQDYRPGAAGGEGCGLVCVPAETGHDCPRCGSIIHERKPGAISRTWALVIGAVVLYIPANVYPVLTVMQLGAGQPSTILGGVEELLASGLYPLAALVFFASILVPLFKLLGLGANIMSLGGIAIAIGDGGLASVAAGSSAQRWPASVARIRPGERDVDARCSASAHARRHEATPLERLVLSATSGASRRLALWPRASDAHTPVALGHMFCCSRRSRQRHGGVDRRIPVGRNLS